MIGTTRYYFPTTGGVPPDTYALGTVWTGPQGNTARDYLTTTKRAGIPELNKSALDTYTVDPARCYIDAQRSVSAPFDPGPVSGHFRLVTRVVTNTATPALVPDLFVRLVLRSLDGVTLRGVLFEGVPTGPKPTTTKQTGVYTATFDPGTVAQAGDVLVFERGGSFANTTQYQISMDMPIRDDAALADFPATDGLTGDGNPWLEITTLAPAPTPIEVPAIYGGLRVDLGDPATPTDVVTDARNLHIRRGLSPSGLSDQLDPGTLTFELEGAAYNPQTNPLTRPGSPVSVLYAPTVAAPDPEPGPAAWDDAIAATGPALWHRLNDPAGTLKAPNLGTLGRTWDLTYAAGITYGRPALLPGDDAAARAVQSGPGSSDIGSAGLPRRSYHPATYAVKLRWPVGTAAPASFWLFTATNCNLRCSTTSARLYIYGNRHDFSWPAADVLWNGAAHLVVMTIDGTAARVYVDGALVATIPHTRGPGDQSTGNLYNYGPNSITGPGEWSDSIAWDRVLTGPELDALQGAMVAPAPPPPPPPPVVAARHVFTGTITRARLGFSARDAATDDLVVHLEATDAIASLSTAPHATAIGGSYAQRIHHITDPLGVATVVHDTETLKATPVLPTNETTALGNLRLVRDTNHGIVFVDKTNTLQAYADRDRPLTDVAATFTDVRTPGAVHYTALEPVFDTAELVNVVTVESLTGDGAAVSGTYSDADSLATWGPGPGSVTVNEGQPDAHAYRYLFARADPTLTAERVVFNATEDPAVAADLELYQTARVIRTGLLDETTQILALEHHITHRRWTVAVTCRPAEGLPTRWVDLPPALTWAQVDPALSWFDVVTWTP